MIIHTDCRYYRGDRPCLPHKKRGRICEDCPEHDPVSERILIIKLGAMGDVLRTTSILWGLKERYPKSSIAWVVGYESAPLLYYISQIDRILPFNVETLALLQVENFNISINLDLSSESAALATLVKSDKKLGYTLGTRGEVLAANPEAIPWLEMSLNDTLKKANKKTYQKHMLEILGLDKVSKYDIIVNMNEDEKIFAEEIRRRFKIPNSDTIPIIGFNIGAGGRWQHKPWRVDGYTQIAYELDQKYDARIILLAGRDDEKRITQFKSRCPVPVHDPGRQSLRRFISVVSLCDLVVTGDTLALHLALGLGKKVLALFGPTSAAEIEMYGLGEKIVSDIECAGCYLTRCDKKPHCMDVITNTQVLESVERILGERKCGAD